MGIIADKTKESFDTFKESLENQMPIQECIGNLVKSMVEVADRRVNYQFHRDILDKEIEKQLIAL